MNKQWVVGGKIHAWIPGSFLSRDEPLLGFGVHWNIHAG
jgi:hypothetical protein